MEKKIVQEIDEQDIEFFKERKTSRLYKEYYRNKYKSITELIDLKKNLKLANQLSELLKFNENDLELIHSKSVIMKYCLEKYKNIKKADLEVLDAEKRINNNKPEEMKKEETDNNDISNGIHEEVKLLLSNMNKIKDL